VYNDESRPVNVSLHDRTYDQSILARDGLPSRGEVSSSRVTTRRVSPATDEIDLSIAALWIDEGRGW